jgi:hypothetical protein
VARVCGSFSTFRSRVSPVTGMANHPLAALGEPATEMRSIVPQMQLRAAPRRLQERSLSRRWQRTVQTVQSPRAAPRPLAETVNSPTVLMRRSQRAAPRAAILTCSCAAPRRLQSLMLGIRWQRTVQTVQWPRAAPPTGQTVNLADCADAAVQNVRPPSAAIITRGAAPAAAPIMEPTLERTVQTVQWPHAAPRPLAETVNRPTVLMRRPARAGAENSDPHVQLRAAPRRLPAKIVEPMLATHRPDGAIAPSGSAPTG